MHSGKDPFFLPYTYTPLISTVLQQQYYQRCETYDFENMTGN